MALTSQIVQVSATVTTAPTVSTLQQSGCFVSVGGTTQSTGTYAFYSTQAGLLAALSATGNFAELTKMGATFFAQNLNIGVYVLELGAQGSASAGITALTTWIAANLVPQVFYAYLVPATWDTTTSSNLNTLAALYSSTTSKTYFFITTTSANISSYLATTKSAVCVVNSPTAASTEFQAAAPFAAFLANNPQIASPAAPMNFRFLSGVTPWAYITTGGTSNVSTINSILTSYGNLILSGAEGGISTATLRNGTTMDGNQLMFWYAVDWILIQAQIRLANAIINGSNSNPPLYYNQFGINQLLGVLDDMGSTGVSYGLLLSATFTATSFAAYTAANPSNYAAGIYDGFSCVATPQLGFTQIEFFLNATTFTH